MKYIDFQILDDILDSFLEDVDSYRGIGILKSEREGQIYPIIRSVYTEKILKVFLPYTEILGKIYMMTEQ